MYEKEILDVIETITLNRLSNDEKALVLAHVCDSQRKVKTAQNLQKTILGVLEDHAQGLLKESQHDFPTTSPKAFQDFSENMPYAKPFEILNKKEIDDYLDKMSSKEWDGNYFDDTWDFYHPVANMTPNGVGRHRSDFNTITNNQ